MEVTFKMLAAFLKKYRTMVLCGLFFFYFGCFVTLTLMKIDCADAMSKLAVESNHTELRRAEYGVLILSGPDNSEKRQTIRNTWMTLVANLVHENGEKVYNWRIQKMSPHFHGDLVKFYFVIGVKGLSQQKLSKLSSEDAQHNDLLLLENLEDTYQNLSLKMLQSVKWFSDNMKRLKYLIKCDDDSFVRIDLMIRDLDSFAPHFNAPDISDYVTFKKKLPNYKGLYWGYFNGRARVYLKGRWQEEDWFLCDNYLPYALGGGYVISRSIVDYIARNVDILSKYRSEDVSMGLWTSSLDGINRVHDVRFDTEWKSRGCDQAMLVRHKQTPEDMAHLFMNLIMSEGETLCNPPVIKRKPYLYKWGVLPSSCCT